jgi:tRNA modification GTPase
MLSRHTDPIAAIATAPGRGAVGIVRVSGTSVQPIIAALCGKALKPREATYLPFAAADGSPIDQGLAIHFPAPHSYTGEDVLELQAHGGPVVLQLLLARCLEAGQAMRLRVAAPGEFTERAFLNDKIDLAQAEAHHAAPAARWQGCSHARCMRCVMRWSICACWWRLRWIFRKKRSTI